MELTFKSNRKETLNITMRYFSLVLFLIFSLANQTVAQNDFEILCGEGKRVDLYGAGNGSCSSSPDITVEVPTVGNVYKNIVEVVYKNDDPGASITILDDNGTSYTLPKVFTSGTSSYVYRLEIPGSFDYFTHNNEAGTCGVQSMIIYAFRNVDQPFAQTGSFENGSGHNNIQTFTIDISNLKDTDAMLDRNMVVTMPITELSNDGRYMKVTASVDGAVPTSNSTFICGADTDLNDCCLNIVEIPIDNVSWDAETVTVVVDTRNGENAGHSCGSMDGQSWISAGFTTVDIECRDDQPKDWLLSCDDHVKVDLFGAGADDCSGDPDAMVNITNFADVDSIFAEVVFKSEFPGNYVEVMDQNGFIYFLWKRPTPGYNLSEVFSGQLPGGAISSLSVNHTVDNCGSNSGLQSLVVYTFRDVVNDVASSGKYVAVGGYNNTVNFSIPVVTDVNPRNLTVTMPISELTTDGRFLTVVATAGGVSNSVTICGPDPTLNVCCLDIVEIPLVFVDGSVDQVDIEVRTATADNPGAPCNVTGAGQSWVSSGFVGVDVECNACDLTQINSSSCHDNGTAGNDSDDYFDLSVTGTIQGGSGNYVVKIGGFTSASTVSGAAVNIVGNGIGSNPSLDADGSSTYTVRVQDASDSSCFVEFTAGPISSCSDCGTEDCYEVSVEILDN